MIDLCGKQNQPALFQTAYSQNNLKLYQKSRTFITDLKSISPLLTRSFIHGCNLEESLLNSFIVLLLFFSMAAD